ncbi:MAG: S9 family peptidase [Proteobacteria bacterium]|nr:S9 family peptidase [Pseudomonadota bacterium]
MIRITTYVLAGLALTLASFPHQPASAEVPLEEFTKLPLYGNLKISPTGEYLAATVRNDDGQMSLVIMNMRSNEVTATIRGFGRDFINDYNWANDERIVATLGRQYGSLDAPSATHEIVAVNWDGKRQKWLFGRGRNANIVFDRTYKVASILNRLADDDDYILVGVNDFANPNSTYTVVYRLNIYSGKMTKVTTAPTRGALIVTDNTGAVRLAISEDPDNKNAVVIHKRDDKRWKLMGIYHGKEGTITPLAFAPDNILLYMLDNRETDTDSLYFFNTSSEEVELIYTHDVVDISSVEIAPDGTLLGVYTEPDYPDFTMLNTQHELSGPLTAVRNALRGFRVRPTSMTEDGKLAIIRADGDRVPARYYLFDVDSNQLSQIASVLPGIDSEQMRPMEPYKLKVRDGTEMFAYLTRPDDSDGPFPMVVLPHGGPHGVRDHWRFSADVQMLASRGYAVLQVNYRGSGGYGRDFLYSGYGKWGTVMQDDLTDATRWAIEAGIAAEDRICIYGGSYGGYAAMMGVLREPDLYQCAIAYVGVYDLELMFKKGDIPTRDSGLVFLKEAVGEDKEDLRARSPVHNLDKLKAPVFIVHGGEDFRVDIEHAYRLRKGLEELGKPYEWLVKPKEGHGFYKPENRLELYERMLAFLEKHIGRGQETLAGGSK